MSSVVCLLCSWRARPWRCADAQGLTPSLSTQGVPGAPGLPGAAGPPGEAGDAGMDGANGAEGARGAAVVMPPVQNAVSPVPLANTAYTPEQYAQYLQEAVGAAQAAGCACAKAPGPKLTTVVVAHKCPCVSQQLHAIVQRRGRQIKAALHRVMRASAVAARRSRRQALAGAQK